MYKIKSFDFLGLAGFTFTLLTGRDKKNLTHNSSKILLDKAFLCYTVSLRVSDWLKVEFFPSKHFFVKKKTFGIWSKHREDSEHRHDDCVDQSLHFGELGKYILYIYKKKSE